MTSPRAEVAPFDTATRVFDWAALEMLCWMSVPIAIAVVLAAEVANYWSAMFSSPIGFLLLGLAIGTVGISVGLVLLARRVAAPSRGRLLAGVGIVLLAFVVFLGPAVIFLLRPRASPKNDHLRRGFVVRDRHWSAWRRAVSCVDG